MVFFRILDGRKTMPIFQNVLTFYTKKGDIMGYNEQWSFSIWSFILRGLNCHSNLNLPSTI